MEALGWRMKAVLSERYNLCYVVLRRLGAHLNRAPWRNEEKLWWLSYGIKWNKLTRFRGYMGWRCIPQATYCKRIVRTDNTKLHMLFITDDNPTYSTPAFPKPVPRKSTFLFPLPTPNTKVCSYHWLELVLGWKIETKLYTIRTLKCLFVVLGNL